MEDSDDGSGDALEMPQTVADAHELLDQIESMLENFSVSSSKISSHRPGIHMYKPTPVFEGPEGPEDPEGPEGPE